MCYAPEEYVVAVYIPHPHIPPPWPIWVRQLQKTQLCMFWKRPSRVSSNGNRSLVVGDPENCSKWDGEDLQDLVKIDDFLAASCDLTSRGLHIKRESYQKCLNSSLWILGSCTTTVHCLSSSHYCARSDSIIFYPHSWTFTSRTHTHTHTFSSNDGSF